VEHHYGSFEAALEALIDRAIDRKLGQPPQARYVSKEKLANLHGVKERTIKSWRAKGLPGVRVGREVMFDVRESDRWIEGQA